MRNFLHIIPFVILITLSSSLYECNTNDLNTYQRETLKQRTRDYLAKDSSIYDHLKFTEKGLYIYPSTEAKSKDSAEFFCTWNDLWKVRQLLQSLDIHTSKTLYFNNKLTTTADTIKEPIDLIRNYQKTLKGVKIALDPGHISGSPLLDSVEFRVIKFEIGNDTLILNEAELNYQTCLILKDLLEAQGAEVLMSREEGMPSWKIGFKEWMQKHKKHSLDSLLAIGKLDSTEYNELLKNAKPAKLFHKVYKYIDFRVRAKKINDFNPDLTLMVHYNVAGYRDDDDKLVMTNDNYCMTFVPGSFVEGELSHADDRFHLLRLLLTEGIPSSIQFSDEVTKAITNNLNIPVANNNALAFYLKDYSIQTEKHGVFCRNLAMTRQINGTLCFAEPLYQDNVNEAYLLAEKDYNYNGKMISKRVLQVAEAYFEAIVNYLDTH